MSLAGRIGIAEAVRVDQSHTPAVAARAAFAPLDSLRQDVCSSPINGLRVPLPDVVAMQTRQPNLEGAGEIPLRRLVKEALRMRPSRIVVGEVRQEECLDLTQSASAHAGCKCSNPR